MMPRSLNLSLSVTIAASVILISTTSGNTQTITIDARQQPAPPETGYLKQGSNTSPGSDTIGLNSRYLTRNGKPWLPVMGEFHYSRYPAAEWEAELRKMKAGGVDIVASYVIWIHHEEVKDSFDWSGQRNLRRFAELAARQGLYFYPRIGPWSHAEVRNGGFPDWIVREIGEHTRSNDSTYLRYVARWYDAIAEQLRGLLWKDGGPIIGIQLENEYNQRGPGRGEEHVLKLKQLALRSGFDVPLYTLTGWDNTVLPAAEFVPVFGGYPDMPWDQSSEELPPGEVYAFRFENRWAGNLTAQGPNQQLHATAQAALSRYPFLGAEYGGGIQITYHRRPVISSDDVAAMLPVQIGSGVNLYGYYMFHGGTNPEGKLSTLHESQRTGYPTDVPVKSYDFQTLLSEFGEPRESFRKTKLVHYFLNDFGDRLAPMVVRRPDRVPANAADTSVLRVAARTLGNSGFIFGNNYIRNYNMPARRNVQIALSMPDETVRVPETAIDIASGAYFIWPVNLDMNGVLLKYGTAQLITRSGKDWYFFAVSGITPEFAFDATTLNSVATSRAASARRGNRVFVRDIVPGRNPAFTVLTRARDTVNVYVLTERDAQNAWKPTNGQGPLQYIDEDSAAGPKIMTRVTQLRTADSVGPVPLYNAVTWRKVAIALAPSDSAFDRAARFRIEIPANLFELSDDAILEINYVGDVARLYSGDELLNDNFFNGTPWRIGLKRYAEAIKRGPLELRILPLRADAPIYIEPDHRPQFNGQRAELVEVQLFARKVAP